VTIATEGCIFTVSRGVFFEKTGDEEFVGLE